MQQKIRYLVWLMCLDWEKIEALFEIGLVYAPVEGIYGVCV